MKFRLLSNAETDLELAADFYESQSEGLGEYFLTSLISDIESLKLYAGIHETRHGFFSSGTASEKAHFKCGLPILWPVAA